MAVGDLLYSDGPQTLLARVLIPPEDAAAEALAAYLSRQRFFIHQGSPAVDELSRPRDFCLEHVATDWPDPNTRMTYPSATIIGGDDTQHTGHGPPYAMESLWDPVAETVPWNLGVATGTFQVDFWTDSVPVRQAIAARLPGLFSPSESRSGILLQLPATYLCLTGRYSLIGKGRQDAADTVWAGEHRLRATVRWEVADVELRRGVAFRPELGAQVETK